MQANAAEMMRLACRNAIRDGVKICMPVHDALLIEARIEDIQATIDATQRAMAEASKIILEGFELRSKVKEIRYPDRYMDDRGEKMWNTINTILKDMDVGID